MHSYGLTFKVVADGGTLAALTGEIMDAKGPGMEITMSEVKNITPTAARKVFEPGLVDEGEYEMTLGFRKADITALRGMVRALLDMEVGIPGTQGGAYTFSGYLQSLGNEYPYDDIIAVPVKFKISGSVTWTAAV